MFSLAVLNDDVMMLIFTYLEPYHIINIHHAFSQIVNELFQRNSHFKMPCYGYIYDDIVDWFDMNHFPLDLITEKRRSIDYTYYLKNGKRHRDDDLPAVISDKYGEFQHWYQNGKLYRENGKPAKIESYFSGYKKLCFYDNDDRHVRTWIIHWNCNYNCGFELVKKKEYVDVNVCVNSLYK